jgi:hypothetical protein
VFAEVGHRSSPGIGREVAPRTLLGSFPEPYGGPAPLVRTPVVCSLTAMTQPVRPWTAVVPGSLFVVLTACAAWGPRVRLRDNSSSVSVSSGGAASWSSTATGATSIVSCTGQRCEVTLGGAGATGQVLGATLAFDRISGGRGTVRVDDVPVSLREGDEADRGTVHLRCTRVTATSVTLVVTPR